MRWSALAAAGAVVLVGVGAAGTWWWMQRPPPAAVAITFSDLPSKAPAVRIRGTAHYLAMVRQDVPGHVFVEARTYYVYGLFPAHDTSSRAIRLLVRTQVPPEDGVSFEYLEVEGLLYPPDRYTVPWRTEDILSGQSDYFFTDDMLVVEPWAQRAWDPADDVKDRRSQ